MTIKVLLSSEIGPFEEHQTDVLENSMKILDFAQIPYVNYIGNLSKIKDNISRKSSCLCNVTFSSRPISELRRSWMVNRLLGYSN